MKKSYFIIIFGLLCGLFIAGCDDKVDDFAEITGKDAIETTITSEETLETALNGMYSAMNDETAFGKYVFTIGDLISDNAFVSLDNTNRFTVTDDYRWNETSGDYISAWEQLYDVVAQANVVLEYKDLIEVDNQSVVDNLAGQAYIGRAFSFYYLATFWAQNPNSGIQPEKGIMLPTIYNANNDLPRSSVAATWDQIESDLLNGLSLLSEDNANTKFGRTAANILLSRVYLFLGNYINAVAYADDALNSTTYGLVSKDGYVASWVDEASNESVFQLSYTSGDNLTLEGLASIYDDLGYGDVMFREYLYNSFPADDVRKDLLTVSDRTIDDPIGYWNLKYPYDSGVGGVGELDVRLIRMSEAWLNKIEALYHTDETTALQELNAFAATRHSNIYSSAGTALLDDILFERQLEFFSEGMRFMDLKRNERDIVEGTNCVSICTVTYPNDLFVFPIPLTEINANTAISDADQNPGY